jgi:hypothetical protein
MPGMATGIAHHFGQEIVDERLESTVAVDYSDILHCCSRSGQTGAVGLL